MDLNNLIALSSRYCDANISRRLAPQGASIYIREAVSDMESFLYEPVLCLVLQGSKVTSIGDQTAELLPGDALIVSHHLPVVSRITRASRNEPYLAAILTLDMSLMRGLHALLDEAAIPENHNRSLSHGPASAAWLEPLTRYFDLIDNPLDAKILGPSILREVHYRLLLTPLGGMLRKLMPLDSHASRIAKAIGEIRLGFRETLSVLDLARTVAMSPSSFHTHFKSITGTTPLQYQKELRLMEARTLLAAGTHSVSNVAFEVGYESSTHFSRDFARKFGLPPSKSPTAIASRA